MTARVRPLTPRQRDRLGRVVEVARTGTPLVVACRNSGIRYETALRGLGLPTGGATVLTSDVESALARWPHDVAGVELPGYPRAEMIRCPQCRHVQTAHVHCEDWMPFPA